MCGILAYFGDINVSIHDELRTTFTQRNHRGPDHFAWENIDSTVVFGFQRLAIREISEAGNQPIWCGDHKSALICNGEVYNEQQLYEAIGISKPTASSDCAVIIPLITKFGIQRACEILDSEFAFVFYDHESRKVLAARDPIGIRPLFYGIPRTGEGIVFASEVKMLAATCQTIRPFPPGHYFDGERFVAYRDLTKVATTNADSDEQILSSIETLLVEAVRKRMVADVQVGYLLSGGLDSSLVCAIAARMANTRIETFSVGMIEDAIDIKYAEIVSSHLGSLHHNIFVTQEQALAALDEVIFQLETWDITTVRASLGMYLICKWIRKNTNIKVLLTGEVSDELFGYKYTDYAPTPEAFQEEAAKRVRELYMYDVLRADRCISAHSLEARVPFGDLDFVSYVMSIPSRKKMNTTGMGKALLRNAFAGKGYLPDTILFREKAAFSDAMGHSLVDTIKDHASRRYTDADVRRAGLRYPHRPPFTKESLLYREIFERHYPGQADLIHDYWMPNKQWENCNVSDPSARVLPNYGASGH